MELKRRGGPSSRDHDHVHDAENTRPRDVQPRRARTSDTAGLVAGTEGRSIWIATAVRRPTLPWPLRDGPGTSITDGDPVPEYHSDPSRNLAVRGE